MSIRRIACALILCALALLPAVLASCGGAEDGKQVVLYCSVDQDIATGIIEKFERQTGIRVCVRFDEEARKTTGLVMRLRAEADHPAADVFWSSEIFQTIRLAEEGILGTYNGPEAESSPAQFADANGRWHAFALRGRVIAYDTRRVAVAEAPRRLEDLLDPKWKGRIVMAQPRYGTTRGDVASWFAHYGPERARQILAGLKANEVRLVQGNSTAVRTVAQGQADVCLTDTDDVYVAQRNGWPIAMNPLNQNGRGALAIPNTAALVAGGPHPGPARKLQAFLLSEAVERDLAESDSHNTPIRKDLAAQFPRYSVGAPLMIDYTEVARQMPAAMAAVEEVFR